MFLLYLTKIPHVPIRIYCSLSSHWGSAFPWHPPLLLQASARSLLQLKKPSLLGGYAVQPSHPACHLLDSPQYPNACPVLQVPEHSPPEVASSTGERRRITFLKLLAPCLHSLPYVLLEIFRKLVDIFHRYNEGLFFSSSLSYNNLSLVVSH